MLHLFDHSTSRHLNSLRKSNEQIGLGGTAEIDITQMNFDKRINNYKNRLLNNT